MQIDRAPDIQHVIRHYFVACMKKITDKMNVRRQQTY